MRKYIRHPIAIPILYVIENEKKHEVREYIRNMSAGGIAFNSKKAIKIGTYIELYFPTLNLNKDFVGEVLWCRLKEDESFEIGVEFLNAKDIFTVRLIEQICYIIQYKNKVFEESGKKITDEQAAREWIEKYAGDFPT